MTLIRGQGHLAERGQAFKASTNRSSNKDHKNPLGSNKSKLSKALTKPSQALFSTFPVPDVARYTQKDIDHLLQTFLQASKGGSEDKPKAKTLYVYRGRSHIKCYNFCQQYKDHFATCGATGSNQMLFAASFL